MSPLEECNQTKSTLLIGAGMSFSLAPLVKTLVEQVSSKQALLESSLGLMSACSPLDPSKDPEQLYEWAEEVVNKLVAQGFSSIDAKFKLAEALGITRDPKWQANVRISLRGTTPRHRVVARLAREGKLETIWSLNWDTWLEAALTSIGINDGSSHNPLLPSTWVSKYATWVPQLPIPPSDAQTITILKPHGCVKALLKKNGVFVLTKKELNLELSKQPSNVITFLKQSLANKYFICVGWKAAEGYFQQLFDELGNPNASTLNPFQLKIVDKEPNHHGHMHLAKAYGANWDDVTVTTQPPVVASTDDYFLWIQLRRGLQCLRNLHTTGSDGYTWYTALLTDVDTPTKSPQIQHWLTSWFDDFLPVWNRLCFNCGRVTFHNGVTVSPLAISTYRRDEHIPWGDQNCLRKDLQSASHLLMKIYKNGPNPELDCARFPGALFNKSTGALILPIPSWEAEQPLSVAALQPLISNGHWESPGLITSVSILPIHYSPVSPVSSPDTVTNWKAEVAALMPTSKFAIAANIGLVELNNLKGF